MADIVLERKGQDPFIAYIQKRNRLNKNFVFGIFGATGSGKSYSALRIGELVDPNFSVDNVCFKASEFLDLVNGKTRPLKAGAFIIADEFGIAMSHIDWQNLSHKLVNFVLQSFRYRRLNLCFTAPHFLFMDASSRKLLNGLLETKAIDMENKQVIIKPLLLQTNQKTAKTYFKRLRIITNDGVVPYDMMKVSLPSEELRKQYEEKKKIFLDELNKNIQKDLERIENPEKKGREQRALLKVKRVAYNLHKGGDMTMLQVSKLLGISVGSTHDYIKEYERFIHNQPSKPHELNSPSPDTTEKE